MAEKQRTLKEAVLLSGIGLHTGEKVNIEICPAPANHGYKFQRVDLENQPRSLVYFFYCDDFLRSIQPGERNCAQDQELFYIVTTHSRPLAG